jgi:Tol biopolymer transport system component
MSSLAVARRSFGLSFVLVLAAAGAAQSTARVSVSQAGAQGSGPSIRSAITPDGRYVAFISGAPDLVAGDTNQRDDVFLRDVTNGTLERVNLSNGGAQATGYNGLTVALSSDARYVAFDSSSSNLVAGDTNSLNDVFVRDRLLATTVRASVSTAGAQGDGFDPSISGDGHLVVFSAYASTLVAGDANGGNSDVYMRDLTTNTTSRVSVSTAGAPANGAAAEGWITASGRYVAFSSTATNLVAGAPGGSDWAIYVRDLQAGTTEAVNISQFGSIAGYCQQPCISADGRYVAFTCAHALVLSDHNFGDDIYVRDRVAATTTRVSALPGGGDSNGYALQPAISGDGRYVAFHSNATDLVSNDLTSEWEVFVHDMQSGWTSREGVSTTGVPGDSRSDYPALSFDGRFVAFESASTNLVQNDTNNTWDIFLRDRQVPPPVIYCTSKPNSLGCVPGIGSTGAASFSAGSGFIVRANNILNERQGLLFYSTLGAGAVPFQGGWMCVQLPTKRTSLQNSGGNPQPANDCTGTFAFDFNVYTALHVDPALVPGQHVWAEYWSRDAGSPSTTNLTNAIEFGIGP